MGSNPGALYWMDLTFFHIYWLYKLYCLFEKTENKLKRGRGWPIFCNKNQYLDVFRSACEFDPRVDRRAHEVGRGQFDDDGGREEKKWKTK